MNIVIIGAGRAGTSFDLALRTAGHAVTLHHHDATGVIDADLVVLCVPDDALADVAASLRVTDRTVVAHVAGSRGLEVLAPHRRVASMHPLCALPSALVGARRLRGATYGVSGDPLVHEVVASLEGKARVLNDGQRVLYHASATVAANHLVALLGHVEQLALAAGLELRDFLDLSRQALEDVADVGPRAALTGPASRGDVATIDAHLAAMPDAERATYVALAHRALTLAAPEASWSI